MCQSICLSLITLFNELYIIIKCLIGFILLIKTLMEKKLNKSSIVYLFSPDYIIYLYNKIEIPIPLFFPLYKKKDKETYSR